MIALTRSIGSGMTIRLVRVGFNRVRKWTTESGETQSAVARGLYPG